MLKLRPAAVGKNAHKELKETPCPSSCGWTDKPPFEEAERTRQLLPEPLQAWHGGHCAGRSTLHLGSLMVGAEVFLKTPLARRGWEILWQARHVAFCSAFCLSEESLAYHPTGNTKMFIPGCRHASWLSPWLWRGLEIWKISRDHSFFMPFAVML